MSKSLVLTAVYVVLSIVTGLGMFVLWHKAAFHFEFEGHLIIELTLFFILPLILARAGYWAGFHDAEKKKP